MGTKGSKLSVQSSQSAGEFVERLLPIGDVTSKKMFGGYGIFEAGTMFALVNSEGEIFLKVSEANRARFDAAGSVQHGRMPYYRIPDAVLDEDSELLIWAKEAIQLSKGG